MKPKRTPRPAPASPPEPLPPAPPLRLVPPGALTFETCRIRLHNRPIKSHFYAVPYDGGPVLARSPYFKLEGARGDSGLSAPEALHMLVEELRESGWQQIGSGRAPWDLRFERAGAVHETAAP